MDNSNQGYEQFHRSLHIGDKFVVQYVSNCEAATREIKTHEKTFEILKIYDYVMKCQTYRNIIINGRKMRYRASCWINIKDLYTNHENAVVYPSRQELILRDNEWM